MTDDQQFIVGLITAIVPTSAAILTYLQSRSTHTAVNGLVAKNTRRARAQGRTQGRAEPRIVDLAPVQPPVVLAPPNDPAVH